MLAVIMGTVFAWRDGLVMDKHAHPKEAVSKPTLIVVLFEFKENGIFFKEISINEIKFSKDIKSIPLKNAKRSPVRGQ